MLRLTRRGLETWHGRDVVTLANERASKRGTQNSTYTNAPVLDPTTDEKKCISHITLLGILHIPASASSLIELRVVLSIRLEKVFEESVNLFIRLRCRAVTFPIRHGYAVVVSQKLVDCDRMIESLPALGRVFGAA